MQPMFRSRFAEWFGVRCGLSRFDSSPGHHGWHAPFSFGYAMFSVARRAEPWQYFFSAAGFILLRGSFRRSAVCGAPGRFASGGRGGQCGFPFSVQFRLAVGFLFSCGILARSVALPLLVISALEGLHCSCLPSTDSSPAILFEFLALVSCLPTM